MSLVEESGASTGVFLQAIIGVNGHTRGCKILAENGSSLAEADQR
jgi:hypothetical protein